MANKEIVFNDDAIAIATTYSVWTKARWSDTWVFRNPDEIQVTDCVWSCAPSMPTATLHYDYGAIRKLSPEDDDDEFALVLKQEFNNLFVRIVFASIGAEPAREWYGIIKVDGDQQWGSVDVGGGLYRESGRLMLSAYGLEKLLVDQEIASSAHAMASMAALTSMDYLPAFNARGLPNRSPNIAGGASQTFHYDTDLANYWDTASIVQYALSVLAPQPTGTPIEWMLDSAHVLPTVDRPVIEQRGLRVYDLLDRVVNRKRGLLWWLEVDSSDRVVFKTASMLSVPITPTIPGVTVFPSAKETRQLRHDLDQLTTASLKDTEIERVDRVVVRGAIRRSIGTFSVIDQTLAKGWTSDQENDYQAGPGEGDGIKEQQDRVREHRSKPELRNVYRYFIIPKDWSFEVAGGRGAEELKPMFRRGTLSQDTSSPPGIFYPDLDIKQTLSPLIEGVDYSGSAVGDGDFELPAAQEAEPKSILVMLENPLPGGAFSYIDASQVAKKSESLQGEFAKWSATVTVPRGGKGVYVNVTGAEQWVLDALNFDRLDTDERYGSWSYREEKMRITLAIDSGHYVAGEWTRPDISGLVRTKYVYAGDTYRKDYVAPNTVVGVDTDGTLLYSNGGFIPKESVGDDEAKLKLAAELIGKWYTIPHKVLQLQTKRMLPPDDLGLGDLITEIGGQSASSPDVEEINSSITQIRIRSPLGNPTIKQAPTLSITTFAGELDPLQIVPPQTRLFI